MTTSDFGSRETTSQMRRNIRFSAPLLILLAAACADDARPARVAVGEPVPAYAAPTMAGDTISLAELRGQAVVLNIWATWCPPCREEMPGLDALQRQYADQGLRVIGVSIDGRNAAREVDEFLRSNGIEFMILHDADERVTRTFRTIGVPETFLIDREGRLVQRWIGKIDPASESIQRAVQDALASGDRRS
jgi:peroxiredoxin